MKKEGNRLTDDMDVDGMLIAMWDGNTEALQCMVTILEDDQKKGIEDIRLLDSLEIYGKKISVIWNICCKCNIKEFKKTLKAFRKGKYTKEKIHENLSGDYVKPFV